MMITVYSVIFKVVVLRINKKYFSTLTIEDFPQKTLADRTSETNKPGLYEKTH